MAVALRAAGTPATGTTTLSVTVPATAQTGDLLVMAVNACPTTTTLCSATATGWTPQGTTVQDTGSSSPYPNLTILTRACQAADPGGSVSVSWSGNTPATCAGVIIAYSGADTSATPFAAQNTYVEPSSVAAHPTASITTTVAEWVLVAGAQRGTTTTAHSMSAPYAERCDVQYGTGGDAKLCFYDSNGTVTAGTIGPLTITSDNTTGQFVSWLGAVKVASAATSASAGQAASAGTAPAATVTATADTAASAGLPAAAAAAPGPAAAIAGEHRQASAGLASAAGSAGAAQVAAGFVLVAFFSDTHPEDAGHVTRDTETRAAMNANTPDLFVFAGDMTTLATAGEYTSWDGVFGDLKTAGPSKIRPATGNHDMQNDAGASYDTYWGSNGGSSGHWYSFDVGGWHAIILACNTVETPTSGSAQYTWLSADLAAHKTMPTFLVWHVPRWNIGSSHGPSTDPADVWALFAANPQVEFVVNGHEHLYQRFYRQTAAGTRDDANGVAEFVNPSAAAPWTGNTSSPGATTAAYGNADNEEYGFTAIRLYADRYAWRVFAAQNSPAFGATAGTDASAWNSQQIRVNHPAAPGPGAAGTGPPPAVTVTVNAGQAAAGGTAAAPYTSHTGLPAGSAAAPGPSAALTVPAGAPAGTGAAPSPGTSASVMAGTAAGGTAAPAPSCAVQPPAGIPAGGGLAPQPGVTATAQASAGLAAGTGQAAPPIAAASVSTGTAGADATASQPSTQITAQGTGPAGPAETSAQAPAPATAITTPAGPAGADGIAPQVVARKRSTGLLYAGTATSLAGGWASTPNAVGPAEGDYATWTATGPGTATLELGGFGAQDVIPRGAVIGDIRLTVRHAEDPADAITSVTAQPYAGTTVKGDPQALTVTAGVHEDQVTVTGLTWDDLADLRVRLTVARTG